MKEMNSGRMISHNTDRTLDAPVRSIYAIPYTTEKYTVPIMSILPAVVTIVNFKILEISLFDKTANYRQTNL